MGGLFCGAGFGGGIFAADFGGGFVFAEAFEGGLADEVVGGPGGEVYLRDESGFDRDDAVAGFGGRLVERVGSGAEFFELGADDGVSLLGEAGAGASGVDEVAGAVVVAEEERADAVDSGVAFGGEGEAADDELLLVDAFELDPAGGAAGDVTGVGAFGDDAFGVHLAGLAEDDFAVAFEVFAEADVLGRVGEKVGEDGLCVRAAVGCGGFGR